MTTSPVSQALDRAGAQLQRYGLVFLILWFGAMKYRPAEAAAIEPLLRESPLLAWLPGVAGVQGASCVIGTIEILIGLAIALRPVLPRVAAIGGLGAGVMFLTTLSFMVTTPGTIQMVEGMPMPGNGGGFLVKDLLLLAASLRIAGDALAASARADRAA